jgi:hypothetical protein
MYYQRTLTIPKGTPETAPVSATLKMAKGTSSARAVVFPSGCCGLVHVRVNDSGWQLIPWSRDEWLAADDETVVDDSPYPMFTVPYTLTVYGYSEDPDNDHTVTLRVTMLEGVVHPGLAKLIAALRGYV